MPRPTKAQAGAEAAERFRERREELALFAESPRPRLENPLSLVSDDILGLFDTHCPFYDHEFLNRVVDVALSWNVETVLLGGDFLDNTVFGRWGHDPDETLEEELATAEALLSVLCKAFKNVVYFLGNYESNRILGKTTNRQLRFSRLVRMFTPPSVDNLYTSYFEWIEVQACSGTWLWAHPGNTSIIAGRVPNMLAGRSCQGKHVVSGHGHLAAMGRNDANTFWAIDSGMVADKLRLGYAIVRPSIRPPMQNGAPIVKHGFPTLLTPFSDFGAEKRKYHGEPPCETKIIQTEGEATV